MTVWESLHPMKESFFSNMKFDPQLPSPMTKLWNLLANAQTQLRGGRGFRDASLCWFSIRSPPSLFPTQSKIAKSQMGLIDSIRSINWEHESFPSYDDFFFLPLFALLFPTARFFLDRLVFEVFPFPPFTYQLQLPFCSTFLYLSIFFSVDWFYLILGLTDFNYPIEISIDRWPPLCLACSHLLCSIDDGFKSALRSLIGTFVAVSVQPPPGIWILIVIVLEKALNRNFFGRTCSPYSIKCGIRVLVGLVVELIYNWLSILIFGHCLWRSCYNASRHELLL